MTMAKTKKPIAGDAFITRRDTAAEPGRRVRVTSVQHDNVYFRFSNSNLAGSDGFMPVASFLRQYKPVTRTNPAPTRKATMAEAWFGVTHTVPPRGSPAYKKMLREYGKKHPRSNPVKTESQQENRLRKIPAGETRRLNGKKVKRVGYDVFKIGRDTMPGKMAAREVWGYGPDARKNPVTTKTGRTLTPENCPLPLAASMLADRANTPKGKKKIAKFANCDYRSAQLAIRTKKGTAARRATGKKFSGKIAKGYDPTADWTTTSKSGRKLSFWKEGGRAEAAPATDGRMGVSLGWWPKT